MKKLILIFLTSTFLFPSVIYYGTVGGPSELDPAKQWDSLSSQVVYQIYDRLVELDPDTYKILPSLAVSWQHSKDGLHWYFDLRKGVKFQDGTEFTSEAVVLSFKRQLNRFLPAKNLFPAIKEVKPLGKYRVEFHLSEPFAPFLYSLTTTQASIISPAAILHGDPSKKPVGTGPYTLEQWNKKDTLILTKNPLYWKKAKDYPDKIVFIIGSSDELYRLLFEGKLDIIDVISFSKLGGIKYSGTFKVHKKKILAFSYLAFNPETRWGKNLYVRKAIYSLWNPNWIKRVFADFNQPTTRILPPYWTKGETIHHEFSLEKAKKIISSARLKDKVKLILIYLKYPLFSRTLKAFSSSAKKAGIKIELKPLEPVEYEKAIKSGAYDIAETGWILDYFVPDNLFYSLISKEVMEDGTPNIFPFNDKTLEKLILTARRIYDEEERFKLYEKAEKRILSYAYIIPLYWNVLALVYNKRVSNLKVDPTGIIIFSQMRKNDEK